MKISSVFPRIECTKIQAHIWMAGLKRGREVSSVRVRKRFVTNISAELDGIWNWQWNAERAIIFRRLLCSTFALYLVQEMYMTISPHVSTYVTRVATASWYRTPRTRRQLIYGNHVGLEPRSNVIILFRALFCTRNCTTQFDLFASGRRVDFSNQRSGA